MQAANWLPVQRGPCPRSPVRAATPDQECTVLYCTPPHYQLYSTVTEHVLQCTEQWVKSVNAVQWKCIISAEQPSIGQVSNVQHSKLHYCITTLHWFWESHSKLHYCITRGSHTCDRWRLTHIRINSTPNNSTQLPFTNNPLNSHNNVAWQEVSDPLLG